MEVVSSKRRKEGPWRWSALKEGKKGHEVVSSKTGKKGHGGGQL